MQSTQNTHFMVLNFSHGLVILDCGKMDSYVPDHAGLLAK